MKKKLLALILGAAMAFGCVFAFAACTDGNGENGGSGNQEESGNQGGSGDQGGSGNQGGSGDQGGSGNQGDSGDQGGSGNQGGSQGSVVKTTVDNFDEWYQALRDTLTAENYTINTHYIDTSSDMNDIIIGKRQGNVSQLTFDENNTYYRYGMAYREHSGNTMTTYVNEPYKYDSTKSYWYISYNGALHFDNEYISTLYNDLFCGPFLDEFTQGTLSIICGFPAPIIDATEESVKASAQSVYAAVVYNEQTAEYTYQVVHGNIYGRDNAAYTFKFQNGKISYLKINSESKEHGFVEVTHTLTYGDATVTFPEEVKTSAALTKTLNNIASGLEGTYTYEKDNVQHKLKFSFYDFFDYLISSTGYYDNSSLFDWEIISTYKIILIFDDDTKAELKIGDNCLIYTDENGKEYTFTKSGQ